MSHRIRDQHGTSWVTRLPKCETTGKRRHPSEESAEHQLTMIEEARGPDDRLNTYPCPDCHSWHVGRSAPDREPRPRRHQR